MTIAEGCPPAEPAIYQMRLDLPRPELPLSARGTMR